jgi:hypothetical protein
MFNKSTRLPSLVTSITLCVASIAVINPGGARAGNAASGPILHFRMNEGSGQTSANAAGGLKSLQLQGATWGQGWEGSALAFGRPSAGSTSNAPFALVSGPFPLVNNAVTFASWVYLEPYSHPQWQAIMSDPVCCNYRLLIENNKRPYLNLGTHSDWVPDNVVVQTGQWQHLALTIQGGGAARFYIDGSEVASNTLYVPRQLPPINALVLASGERNSGFYYSLDGRLDETRVYDRVLDPTEVATLANSAPIPPTATPTPSPQPTADPNECLVSINNGATHTNKRTVTLKSTASSASTMRIGNDGGLNGATQVSYTSSISWTLSDPGKRIATMLVYARYYDVNGASVCGVSSIIDDIIYDPMPPKVSVKPVAPVTSTRPVSVVVELLAFDQEGGSGVNEMQLSTRSDFSDAAWQPFSEIGLLTARSSDRIYARVADAAGNVSDVSAGIAGERASIYLPLLTLR